MKPRDAIEIYLALAVVGTINYFAFDIAHFIVEKVGLQSYEFASTIIWFSIFILSLFGFLIARKVHNLHTVKELMLLAVRVFILGELLHRFLHH